MSDINELIKSGAVPSATPRTSKIFIPEVIVTEPVTSSVSAEMEPKKEEGQPESKIQEVKYCSHVQAALVIRGFDYSQTQKPQIMRENC
jgi:hypothetical protein